jgi:hypothetical protein
MLRKYGRCFHCGKVFENRHHALQLEFEYADTNHKLRLERPICSTCYEWLRRYDRAYWGSGWRWIGLK